jgi:hypothetical protein
MSIPDCVDFPVDLETLKSKFVEFSKKYEIDAETSQIAESQSDLCSVIDALPDLKKDIWTSIQQGLKEDDENPRKKAIKKKTFSSQDLINPSFLNFVKDQAEADDTSRFITQDKDILDEEDSSKSSYTLSSEEQTDLKTVDLTQDEEEEDDEEEGEDEEDEVSDEDDIGSCMNFGALTYFNNSCYMDSSLFLLLVVNQKFTQKYLIEKNLGESNRHVCQNTFSLDNDINVRQNIQSLLSMLYENLTNVKENIKCENIRQAFKSCQTSLDQKQYAFWSGNMQDPTEFLEYIFAIFETENTSILQTVQGSSIEEPSKWMETSTANIRASPLRVIHAPDIEENTEVAALIDVAGVPEELENGFGPVIFEGLLNPIYLYKFKRTEELVTDSDFLVVSFPRRPGIVKEVVKPINPKIEEEIVNNSNNVKLNEADVEKALKLPDWSKKTVEQLKDMLETRKLPKSGKKSELLARLVEHETAKRLRALERKMQKGEIPVKVAPKKQKTETGPVLKKHNNGLLSTR